MRPSWIACFMVKLWKGAVPDGAVGLRGCADLLLPSETAGTIG